MDIKYKNFIEIDLNSIIKEVEFLESEQKILIRALIFNINRIKEVEKNKNGYNGYIRKKVKLLRNIQKNKYRLIFLKELI